MTELKKTASFKEQFAQAAEKQSFDQLTKKFFFQDALHDIWRSANQKFIKDLLRQGVQESLR